ncbi:MAG TPA: collagen-like protein, partial [Polyangiaceae bacterium]|nr:collagen-like protein [Polyangiaceae bacterium]
MNTHTIRRWISALTLAGGVSAFAASAVADVPQTITNQGRLVDADNKPIEGALPVTFAVYDAADAKEPIWSEKHTVTFDEGYFSVSLGSIEPFGDGVFDGSLRYFGMSIGDEPELLPRAPVQSVPYALLARDVNGDIHPTSVSINGTEVINENGEW